MESQESQARPALATNFRPRLLQVFPTGALTQAGLLTRMCARRSTVPRRKRRENGKPWPKKLANGTIRWYWPKAVTGGKFTPMTRPDGSFIDGFEGEAEAMKVWHSHQAVEQAPEKRDNTL